MRAELDRLPRDPWRVLLRRTAVAVFWAGLPFAASPLLFWGVWHLSTGPWSWLPEPQRDSLRLTTLSGGLVMMLVLAISVRGRLKGRPLPTLMGFALPLEIWGVTSWALGEALDESGLARRTWALGAALLPLALLVSGIATNERLGPGAALRAAIDGLRRRPLTLGLVPAICLSSIVAVMRADPSALLPPGAHLVDAIVLFGALIGALFAAVVARVRLYCEVRLRARASQVAGTFD